MMRWLLKAIRRKASKRACRDHDHPVLCAACHASEALGAPSFRDVNSLTRSMHLNTPKRSLRYSATTLNNIANRSSCYQCHPSRNAPPALPTGLSGRCRRVPPLMQCQSCHGTIARSEPPTARLARRTELPTVPHGSATQNNGQLRYTTVFENDGSPRVPVSQMFATNPNTPIADKSLYRFSKGQAAFSAAPAMARPTPSFRKPSQRQPAEHHRAGARRHVFQLHLLPPINALHRQRRSARHASNRQAGSTHKDYGESGSCLACHAPTAAARRSPRSPFRPERSPSATMARHTVFHFFRGAERQLFPVPQTRGQRQSLAAFLTATRRPSSPTGVGHGGHTPASSEKTPGFQ